MTLFIILALTSYLIGSIPFGKIIGLYYGIDIQKRGSGNIGFANVYRTIGRGPALVVLLGDILKGYIPTAYASLLGLSINQTFLIGSFAVLGHLFPVWLGFKGGKGISTSFGILLSLSPSLAFVGIVAWLTVLTFSKIFSLASLSGAWVVLLTSLAFESTREYTLGISLLVAAGTIFHTKNIKRLIEGKEPKSWKW